jgi:hypothetical protein
LQSARTCPRIELSPQKPWGGTPVASAIPPVAAIIPAIFAPVMAPRGSK